jgi:hypothetical protein
MSLPQILFRAMNPLEYFLFCNGSYYILNDINSKNVKNYIKENN